MPYLQLRGALFGALLLSLLAACPSDDDEANVVIDASAIDGDVIDAGVGADANEKILSTQGLYSDIASKTVVAGAIEYEPAWELWSDGAEKRRWLILPSAEAKIDTSDMDHWIFPVGTKLFKEFKDPDSGKLLETRLTRIDEGGEVFMTSFVWNEDESDADLERGGKQNVRGTNHDVPSQTRCKTCPRGEPGAALGFSAIQLSRDDEPNLASLRARMTAPPPEGVDFRPPGDEVTAKAFGYMHANCGVCHSAQGSASDDTCLQDAEGNKTKCMILRLAVSETGDFDPALTEMFTTTVGEVTHGNFQTGFPRVTAGDPLNSAVAIRPKERGDGAQMPPGFASEVADDSGVAAVDAWIESLAP
jgi:hypothetical protein